MAANLIRVLSANAAPAIEIYIHVRCITDSLRNSFAFSRSLSTRRIMKRICPIRKIIMNAAPALYISMKVSI